MYTLGSKAFPFGLPANYSGVGLSNLCASIYGKFGLTSTAGSINQKILDREILQAAKTIILFVVDGLGYMQLRRAVEAKAAPGLEELAEKGGLSPITTVAPSTTTSALTTICTNLTPQEHGVVSYRLYLEEYGSVANMIRFGPVDGGPPYTTRGADPSKFLQVPTAFEFMASKGLEPIVLTRWDYLGSPLSQMMHRGAKAMGYVNSSDLFVNLRHLLSRERKPTFVYAYWDLVDTECHAYGEKSEQFIAEVANFDFSLRRELLDKIEDEGALIVFTADHGHIDTTPEKRLNLKDHPAIVENIKALPSGEPRLLYLHVKEEALERVHDYIATELREWCWLLKKEELLSMGLLGTGEVREESRKRLGDLILIPKEDRTLFYPYTSKEMPLIGRHGGFTPEEMVVPCLWASLG